MVEADNQLAEIGALRDRAAAVVAKLAELPFSQRGAALDQQCGGDAQLRAFVEVLLAREAADRLNAEDRADDPYLHSDIGHYRITRVIATGGMGRVYQAGRKDDFRHKVAIKLIKRGMDSEQIVRRFKHERQVLAALKHPNIAQMLDGGTTEDGLPYFVMEYIDGQPLDDYSDAHRLNVERRLRLFQQVCAAVHFAHQNLVIHRDLKPQNILVVENVGVDSSAADGGGAEPAAAPSSSGLRLQASPKLLDFGLAKLLDPITDSPATAITEQEERPMTPQYASPEQVRGEAITTASDVYSLGVVLYELLAGRRPYEIVNRSRAEVERKVCQMDPSRPSEACVSSAVGIPPDAPCNCAPNVIAERRGVMPQRLQRQLRGDLDNIVMMCLRKEPRMRYQSVEQIAADIDRHLRMEPVLAVPTTLRYRLGKFARRHRARVAAAAVMALALGVGLTSAAVGYVRALNSERQAVTSADDAKRKLAIASEGADLLLFGVCHELPKVIGAQDLQFTLLRKASQHYYKLAGESPGALSEQHRVWRNLIEIGEAYRRIGKFEDAAGAYGRSIDMLKRAIESYAGAEGSDNRKLLEMQWELVEALGRYAAVLHAGGDTPAARRVLDEHHTRATQLAEQSPDSPKALDAMVVNQSTLGLLAMHDGDFEAAERYYARALEIDADRPAASQPTVGDLERAMTRSAYQGYVALKARRFDDSRDAYQRVQSLAYKLRKVTPHAPGCLFMLVEAGDYLGELEATRGNVEAAENEWQSVLDLAEQIAGQAPRNSQYQYHLARIHGSLRDCAARANNMEQAARHLERSHAILLNLVRQAPTGTNYLELLAASYLRCARHAQLAMDSAKTARDIHASAELFERLIAKVGLDNPRYVDVATHAAALTGMLSLGAGFADNADVQEAAATFYHAVGKHKNAAKSLQKAVRLLPKDDARYAEWSERVKSYRKSS